VRIASRAMLPGKSYKPKPYIFPEDFVLLIDSREQNPLCTAVKGLTICRDTLKDGDYSIRGFEDKFSVERKQTSDLFSYIGKERRRTVQKLQRLKTFDYAALVVEASLEDLFSPQLYTRISPEVVRQFFVSVNVRYGLNVYCDRSREKIEMWLLDRAIKFFKVQREVHSA
jgi:ERCC4-type nuclease